MAEVWSNTHDRRSRIWVSMTSDTREWIYNFSENGDVYSMALTNLAFVDISFLKCHSSDNAVMAKVRAYTDEVFNCEDIVLIL